MPDDNRPMNKKKKDRLPARFRPTLWARIHRLAWSAFILALWPLARLFSALEKRKSNE